MISMNINLNTGVGDFINTTQSHIKNTFSYIQEHLNLSNPDSAIVIGWVCMFAFGLYLYSRHKKNQSEEYEDNDNKSEYSSSSLTTSSSQMSENPFMTSSCDRSSVRSYKYDSPFRTSSYDFRTSSYDKSPFRTSSYDRSPLISYGYDSDLRLRTNSLSDITAGTSSGVLSDTLSSDKTLTPNSRTNKELYFKHIESK